jgi:hypothetical protein
VADVDDAAVIEIDASRPVSIEAPVKSAADRQWKVKPSILKPAIMLP